MSEDWDFYFARVDDEIASLYVDLGIARDAPLASHPLLGWVRVEMQDPRPDGLSSDAEFDALIAIEDGLLATLDQVGAIFVGRNTSSGQRDFYFYMSDAGAFEFAARALLESHPDYRFDLGTRPDAEWSSYFNFLSPSEAERQRIRNRHVREALSRHGDCLTAVRPIDHMIILPDASAREAFIAQAAADGFTIESQGSTEEGEAYVNIAREDRPAEIDTVVLKLVEASRELGGHYDGWGCEVCEGPGTEDGPTVH
jgi:regulator of RNase E activity RraB